MDDAAATPSANCQRLEERLAALQAAFAARFAELEATVANLQAQLAAARKVSSNSSKPPSSDIVKPAKPQPPPDKATVRSVANRGTPGTNAWPSRPIDSPHRCPITSGDLSGLRARIATSWRCTACGPADRTPGRAHSDHRAPEPCGLVPPLLQGALCRLACRGAKPEKHTVSNQWSFIGQVEFMRFAIPDHESFSVNAYRVSLTKGNPDDRGISTQGPIAV
jgi:hypothetical protein